MTEPKHERLVMSERPAGDRPEEAPSNPALEKHRQKHGSYRLGSTNGIIHRLEVENARLRHDIGRVVAERDGYRAQVARLQELIGKAIHGSRETLALPANDQKE